MIKENIIQDIREGMTSGILSVDDVLVELDRLMKESITSAIKESGGRVSFSEDCPRIISCCFSEILELDVKEIWFEDELRFLCEEPESGEEYKLDADDFLLGEMRHVVERLK